MVAEVTGIAQQQAWRDRVHPPVERIRPGLWSIPVPMPGSPLRYVLIYAVELPDGVALIDAGWDSEESWSALRDGLATLGGDVADVQAVLITHAHPDHHGLAHRVRNASGAWVGMHAAEAATLPRRYGDLRSLLEGSTAWLRGLGADDEEIVSSAVSAEEIAFVQRMEEPDRLLDDDELLPLPGWDLRTVWTPGHTPGHLCFYSAQHEILFTGDHVLPRITPNITAQPRQLHDPLGDFLGTFDGLRRLDVVEVMPAHEYRFAGLGDRLDELEAHHEARLAELGGILRERPGASTWEVASRLTWSRPWDQIDRLMRRAAVGEALSHLRRLEVLGRARSNDETPDEDDVQRWWPVP